MTERILESYLSAGLLELNGQDAWFDHITKAADRLATYIAANPAELTSFVYSAIDTSDRKDDPARAKASETLKSVWKTYASVSMGSPANILKGIILDAIFQNVDRDPQIKLAVGLLFSSTLSYINLGSEASVLQPILDRLIQDIEEAAEIRWSVPASVQLPEVPEIDAPRLSVQMKSINVNFQELNDGFERAAASNSPNNQYLGRGFASAAAEAIGAAIKEVADSRTTSIKTDALLDAVGELVETYMTTVAERLTSASYGVELRSRLLWWKEAKVSPTARVEYLSLSAITAAALMAFDFQKMLPALAPVSVIAFLRETVRSIVNEEKHISFTEALKELSNAKELNFYRSNQLLNKNYTGVQPLSRLVMAGSSGSENIHQLTLFDSNKKISLPELSVLLFTEIQAQKAVMEVKALEPATEKTPNGEQQESIETDA